MKKLRRDEDYHKIEREKNAEKKRKLKLKGEYLQIEREKDAEAEQHYRSFNLLKGCENYKKTLHRDDTEPSKMELEFLEARGCMPNQVCCCCEGFPHSLTS